MYVKVDNQLPDHPKILAAGYKAAWLFLGGLCYSSRMLTDGFIPAAQVPRLAVMPGWRKAVGQLVAVGLWQEVAGGYQIHDYLDYQESRGEVERRRQSDRNRKYSAKMANGFPIESARIPSGIRADSAMLDEDGSGDGTEDPSSSPAADRARVDVAQTPPHAPPPIVPDAVASPNGDAIAAIRDALPPMSQAPLPAMAASCAAIAQKARLAPSEDLAQVVASHLTLWPRDVLEDHALRYDRWIRQKEGRGESVPRTPATLDTFFARIRPDSVRKHARRPRDLLDASNVSMVEPLPMPDTIETAAFDQVSQPPYPPRRPRYIWGHRRGCRCARCGLIRDLLAHGPQCCCGDCQTNWREKLAAMHDIQAIADSS